MEEEIKKEDQRSEEQIALEIKDLEKKVKDLLDINEIDELIKSNEQIFDYEEKTYRIRKPVLKQKQLVYSRKIEEYTKYIQDDRYLLENDLKKLYLKRNIDIEALNAEIQNKITRRNDLMLKLGKALKDKAPDNELQQFKA